MLLQELIGQARSRSFVDRPREQALFTQLLSKKSFRVLYLHGIAGVGKSAFLELLRQRCQSERLTVHLTEAGDFQEPPERTQVVLIDCLERSPSRESWLRRHWLPQMSANTVVVMAGRTSLSKEWWADPGWHSLLKVHRLGPLSRRRSDRLLQLQKVPATRREAILEFCQGHPAALCVCARHKSAPSGRTPDLNFELMEHLGVTVEDERHRGWLEMAAVARTLTIPVLKHVLGEEEGESAFAWLESQPYMERGMRGLRPWDPVRRVLVADLRWRDPDRYRRWRDLARTFYQNRLLHCLPNEQEGLLFDYFFLHRESLALRDRFVWDPGEIVRSERATAGDVPELLAAITRLEGETAAQTWLRWFQQQPNGGLVFRAEAGHTIGLVHFTSLTQLSADEADPTARRAREYLAAKAPLREGEEAVLVRFWMDVEKHQQVSVSQSLTMVQLLRHSVFTPKLAFTFWAVHDAEFWRSVLCYSDFHLCDDGLFGHDWRAMPPAAWLEELAAREGLEVEPSPSNEIPSLLLDRPSFEQAVRQALRHFRNTQELLQNPLLSTRIVYQKVTPSATPAQRVKALQETIESTVAELTAEPKWSLRCRPLQYTYLQPSALPQEKLAEQLDLPFGTFRRHLLQSLDLLCDRLWQQEIAGKGI